MAIYQIVTSEDKILREKAKEVREITPNIIKLLKNMKDTMYAAEGVGLAAPQIGISKRVIVVDTEEGLLELINPEIITSEGEQTAAEGCLSVPGLVGNVTRAYRVKVTGMDRTGDKVEVLREGLTARVLQHEIDHLEGILYIDKAENIKAVD